MLVEWVKQRLALCSRKIGAWHFKRVFRTYHGGRYCLQCWMNEMTYLPQSSLAWRLEQTGIDSRIDERAEADRYHRLEADRNLSNAGLMIARMAGRAAVAIESLTLLLERKGSRRGQRR